MPGDNIQTVGGGAGGSLVTSVNGSTGDVTVTTSVTDGTITSAKMAGWTVNAQTGTTYTPVLGDAFKILTLTNAGAITLTIPQNSSVAFPVGTQIIVTGLGAGLVTIAAGSGATVNIPTNGSLVLARYQVATLIKTATNVWEIQYGARPPDGTSLSVNASGQLTFSPTAAVSMANNYIQNLAIPFFPSDAAQFLQTFTLGRSATGSTTYTFSTADRAHIVESTTTSATTFTIPLQASVAFSTNTYLYAVKAASSGNLTVQGTAGVQVNGVDGGSVTTTTGWAWLIIWQRAADNWAVTAVGGSSSSADKLGLTPTALKTANYTASAGDFVPCDTNAVGAFTVTLPNAPADGSVVAVKHVTQGSTNAVTVACAGSDVVNKSGGVTSFTLPVLAQGVVLQYKATGAIWYIVTDSHALSQLDLRYQGLDTELTALASLTSAADKVPYFTGSGTAALLTRDTDGTLAANSDTVLATQKATKTYADTKAPKASPTFTGTVTVPNGSGTTDAAAYGQVLTKTGGGLDTVYSMGNITGATTANLANGNMQYGTLAGNVTFTFSGATNGSECEFVLSITQDSTPRTITWPASVKWAGGVAPTLSSGSGAIDQFVFRSRDGGTTWYGATIGKAFA